MKVLLKQARIVDEGSKFHLKKKDILIEKGVIKEIKDKISASKSIKEISGKDLHVSLGWTDLKANFCDPGFEHKETVRTGLKAAEAGGYTHVGILPSTLPVVDGKSQIEYLLKQGEGSVCSVHAIGAITEGMKGENLSEMYDMYQTGARLFSDDLVPVNSGIMYRALLYSKNFGGRVMAFSRNQFVSGKGQVNEGMASTKTGLKADPSISEIIEIERNIRLLEYTEGRLHLTGVSTAEGVDLIRKAKKKGLDLTCDVHASHLIFNEEDVLGFDSNYKLLPPLRFESDRKKLWKGVLDGTIDCIVSDHRPMDKEEKDIEFDNAEFGTISLQTVFASLQEAKEFDLESVIKALTKGRSMVGLEEKSIAEGAAADLTIFSTKEKWTLTKGNIESKTLNSPFLDKELTGKVIGVYNNGRLASK